MKVLLFRYCGANNIHGWVETRANGDYIVVPDAAFTQDFVQDLDRFIQQVLKTESTRSGKKAGGKSP